MEGRGWKNASLLLWVNMETGMESGLDGRDGRSVVGWEELTGWRRGMEGGERSEWGARHWPMG